MENTCCYFGEADWCLEYGECRDIVARKAHRCYECGREIRAGETYERQRGLSPDGWVEYKTCLGCARLRNDVACEGYVFGALVETIWECMGVNIATGEVDEDDEDDEYGQGPDAQ
jgi:hypothetical protein